MGYGLIFGLWVHYSVIDYLTRRRGGRGKESNGGVGDKETGSWNTEL
jgi:hypothetical protein